MMVMLVMDAPASVKPTKSRAPTLPEVPVPGILTVWEVPSENWITSVKKMVWTPEKYAPKNWVGLLKVKVRVPPIISAHSEPPGVVLKPSREGADGKSETLRILWFAPVALVPVRVTPGATVRLE